jgi:hypothetical protein
MSNVALTQKTVGKFQVLLDDLFFRGAFRGPVRGWEQIPLLDRLTYKRLLYENGVPDEVLLHIDKKYDWEPSVFLHRLYDGRVVALLKRSEGVRSDSVRNEEGAPAGTALLLQFLEVAIQYALSMPAHLSEVKEQAREVISSLQLDGLAYVNGKIVEATGAATPLSEIPPVVQVLDWAWVNSAWHKAGDRVITDPDGALTSARTLLETVCIHILENKTGDYPKDGDLQKLYKATAKVLRLSPEQQTEQMFKAVLSGCTAVANGLAGLRNEFGDSHGKGVHDPQVLSRHARLAVNAAGTVALFLVESYLEDADDPS